jgi:large subunit ribosomal protein L13
MSSSILGPLKATKSLSKATVDQKWHLVDATDVILGRLASRTARILMGKHRATYTPHADTGDFVVVINARNIRLTGKKLQDKKYYHHSGYPGGLKVRPISRLMDRDAGEVIRLAVQRMLPKTKLGRKMIKKLKVYVGADHQHAAQDPQPLDVTTLL